MTREVKLSVIFGFAFVLIVGVLLSDHLSGARRATLDGVNPERGVGTDLAVSPVSSAPELMLVDENGRPAPPPPPPSVKPDQPKPRIIQPQPTVITDATPAQSDDAVRPLGTNEPVATLAEEPRLLDTLRERLNRAAGDAVADLAAGNTTPGMMQLARQEPAPLVDQFGDPINQVPTEGDAADLPPIDAVAEAAPAGRTELYEVQEGDTLWSIAASQLGDGRRHTEIMDLNRDRIGKGGVLRIGASLKMPSAVPAEEAPDTRQAADRPAPERRAERSSPEQSKPKSARDGDARSKPLQTASANKARSDAKPDAEPRKPATYTVRKGDTLGKIAQRTLGSTSRMDDLLLANASTLDDEDSLRPGMVLKIPAR
ncbi:MAG: LysM peptidoglycan-binding domain-containing protein [Planctomycetota bacterium]|nr:LysM peptidoglycan-binding domain-containing protein [Planctomycetota bacterium]